MQSVHAYEIRPEPTHEAVRTLCLHQIREAREDVAVIVALLWRPHRVACHADDHNVCSDCHCLVYGHTDTRDGRHAPAGFPARPPSAPATIDATNRFPEDAYPLCVSHVLERSNTPRRTMV